MAASSMFFDPNMFRFDPNWLIRFLRLQRTRPEIARSLATLPEFENVPIPRDLLETLRLSPSVRDDDGTADVLRALPLGTAPMTPPGLEALFPGGGLFPRDFFTTFGASAGGFLNEVSFPREFIRSRELAGRELLRNRGALRQLMRDFGDSLERGDVGAASQHVSPRYYDRSGADAAQFKDRLTAAAGCGQRRRIIFTGARDITAAGNSLGAIVTGAYELDGEATEFTAEVVFERDEQNQWKIASFEPV